MTDVIAVAGPTASGKTALAVELAKRFDGEIIGADSMQIYKKMSVATAKPTPEETQGVPHFLIDFLEPEEEFSAADYVRLAKGAISDISSRRKLPIICGGTGLYIDSLLSGVCFTDTKTYPELRRRLSELAEEKGGGYLLETLRKFDPETADRLHENNVKRIIRAIEIYKTSGITMTEQNRISKASESPYRYLKIFLSFRDRNALYERIDRRVDMMMSGGLLKEAEEILSSGGLKTSRQAIGYKELEPYFRGEKPLSECVERIKQSTRRYAKRQITWFKRDPSAAALYVDDYPGPEELFDAAAGLVKKFIKGEQDEIQ